MLATEEAIRCSPRPRPAAPAEARQEQAEVHDISLRKIPEGLFCGNQGRAQSERCLLRSQNKGRPLQRFSARCSPTSPAPMPP